MDQPSWTATDHEMFAQGATSSPSRHSMGASPSPADHTTALGKPWKNMGKPWKMMGMIELMGKPWRNGKNTGKTLDMGEIWATTAETYRKHMRSIWEIMGKSLKHVGPRKSKKMGHVGIFSLNIRIFSMHWFRANPRQWNPHEIMWLPASSRIGKINGHDSGSDWLDVPTIYFWPIFEAYVREYPHKIWPYMVLIWYSTSILGSWNSHWQKGRPKSNCLSATCHFECINLCKYKGE